MNQINCYIPNQLTEVSEYVLGFIERRLGIEFNTKVHKKSYYSFFIAESDLNLPAYFIETESSQWLEKRNKFNYEFIKGKYAGEEFDFLVPVPLPATSSEGVFTVDMDLIGTIFIMLSRYEEHILPESDFDEIGRFKAESSVNSILLDIPIVDELLILFSHLLETKLHIRNEENRSDFSILPTHDVDRPFEYLYYSPFRLIKRISGDLLQRTSISTAKNRWKKYRSVKRGNWDEDPYNTFKWMMSLSEKYGLTSSFHFIAEATVPDKDQKYDLRNAEIKKLLLEINRRGHSIELHPSYGSSLMRGQLSKETDSLRKVCNDLNINIEPLKSRYHYLRWNNESLEELEKAEVKVDQTLGYAERPGFRCGTSHPYQGFNFQKMEPSSVIIEPLILMEVSLFSDTYLGLSDELESAWEIVENLKDQCKKHKGNFTILWHNNHLVEESMKEFYEQCIST